METILQKLAEHGVLGLIFAASIYYFTKEIKAYKNDIKDKDIQIQNLNDSNRSDAIEHMSAYKDQQSVIKEFVNELKIMNNGK